jgi:bacterioferritin-associated ferredoxin
MYICVCNAVTETDIKKAVKEGANCMHHLESKLGVSTQCGSCACDASACLDRALEVQMNSADLFSL